MKRIKLVEKNEANDEVKAVYKDIEAAFGMVPNLFKTYAHFPARLKVNWEKTKSMALSMMGFSQERIDDLTKNIESSLISPRDKKILEYARKATLTPHKISDTETRELKSFGLIDSQIVEVLGVMELFTGYNKFLDSLAVPPT